MTVFPASKPNLQRIESECTSVIKKMSDWALTVQDQHLATTKLDFKQEETNITDSRVSKLNEEKIESSQAAVKSSQIDCITGTKENNDVDTKPSHSYIALIAMAILSKPSKKVLLGDIYNYISEKFPYYRSKDKSWRNSIRHNLSLNECFIKAGRSENGKGNYWAIHPANLEDFANGDFRRRRARRRVRKSHTALCTRYGGLPFHQHAAFINYRAAADPYLPPYYLTPFNLPNCVRKSNFGIDSLLASQVPSPIDYSPSATICQSALLRTSYPTSDTAYSTTPVSYPLSYPLVLASNPAEMPSESWHETWKKLKAQFQSQT